MNKNIHDTDDFFKDAYNQFEEDPSADVWEKINAGLDKKDADLNRRKFVVWRSAAIVLLLLLAGVVLFDSGVFKTHSGRSNDNNPIAFGAKKSHTPERPAKQHEINHDGISSDDKKIIAEDERNAKGNSDAENNFLLKHNDITEQSVNQNSGSKKIGFKKTIDINPWLVNKKFAIAITEASPQENTNDFLNKNVNILREKIVAVPLIGKRNPEKLFTDLFNNKNIVSLSGREDSVLKSNNTKIKKPEKKNSFVPYWVLTAFASYERAGYRLDSDLPTNIASIKHSEVNEPSFSARVLATRQLTKHWGVQTGLEYYNTAIGITPQKLYALQDPGGDIAFKYITSSGYAYIKPGLGVPPAIGDSLITTDGKHRLQSISIPLMVKYSVGKNKFTISPGAGIEANFLTSAKVETEIEHPSNPEIVFIKKLDGAKPFHWAVVLDAELQYQVSKKLSVNIRAAFRQAISPITKNNVVETFPYSIGTGIGLSLKF
ncbi:MAG: outer membrane beta-barrel protein [Ginsengibacter sp.]